MVDVPAFAAALTGLAASSGSFYLAVRNRSRPELVASPTGPKWLAAKDSDGTWFVYTRDVIPELGLNEQTRYTGYSQRQALAVAKWLNDGEQDRRSIDQVLIDVEATHKAELEAREQRRLAGGTPIHEFGTAEPVDYLEPEPVHRNSAEEAYAKARDSYSARAQRLATWDRAHLERKAMLEHHLKLRQLGHMSTDQLIRLLANDEPPVDWVTGDPAPPAQPSGLLSRWLEASAPTERPPHPDIYTEPDLRAALRQWQNWVLNNDEPELTVEQREQYSFLVERAVALGLKHVLMSAAHENPAAFDIVRHVPGLISKEYR